MEPAKNMNHLHVWINQCRVMAVCESFLETLKHLSSLEIWYLGKPTRWGTFWAISMRFFFVADRSTSKYLRTSKRVDIALTSINHGEQHMWKYYGNNMKESTMNQVENAIQHCGEWHCGFTRVECYPPRPTNKIKKWEPLEIQFLHKGHRILHDGQQISMANPP